MCAGVNVVLQLLAFFEDDIKNTSKYLSPCTGLYCTGTNVRYMLFSMFAYFQTAPEQSGIVR